MKKFENSKILNSEDCSCWTFCTKKRRIKKRGREQEPRENMSSSSSRKRQMKPELRSQLSASELSRIFYPGVRLRDRPVDIPAWIQSVDFSKSFPQQISPLHYVLECGCNSAQGEKCTNHGGRSFSFWEDE